MPLLSLDHMESYSDISRITTQRLELGVTNGRTTQPAEFDPTEPPS